MLRKKSIENLWWKLLVAVLAISGPIIIVGYLYYRSSSCLTGVWDCFEFEAIMLGGGILLFSLPVIIVLVIWEISRRIKEKRLAEKNY